MPIKVSNPDNKPIKANICAVVFALPIKDTLTASLTPFEPKQIVLSNTLTDEDAIADVLASEAGHKVQFFKGAREEKRKYLQLAQSNAQTALDAQYSQQKSVFARYLDLEAALEVDTPIQRMECFDISHTSGQQTVASCVVFNREGPHKSDYRRYNIEGITPGDDYAAMAQALKRRYKSVKEVQKNTRPSINRRW